MALFGGQRDINLFNKVNRELLGDIITQQCAVYKLRLEETRFNLYGEASEGKFYNGPTLFNVLIDRRDQEYPESELGVDFNWGITFKFFREDLMDKGVLMEVGDLILYQEGYYQVDTVISNQYFVGKNPEYPNSPNPLNPGLDKFGTSLSVICETHYEPADKFGITKER